MESGQRRSRQDLVELGRNDPLQSADADRTDDDAPTRQSQVRSLGVDERSCSARRDQSYGLVGQPSQGERQDSARACVQPLDVVDGEHEGLRMGEDSEHAQDSHSHHPVARGSVLRI